MEARLSSELIYVKRKKGDAFKQQCLTYLSSNRDRWRSTLGGVLTTPRSLPHLRYRSASGSESALSSRCPNLPTTVTTNSVVNCSLRRGSGWLLRALIKPMLGLSMDNIHENLARIYPRILSMKKILYSYSYSWNPWISWIYLSIVYLE